MSIPHAQSGEPTSVAPFGPAINQQRTAALFKSEQLEVMRLVLLAGKSMPAHKLAGEITIQCIEGRLEVEINGVSTLLKAGQLVFLLGAVPHSVTALEDASALVTIVLCKAARSTA
jgi:quercetin dioxygenase-like cupin family protein